jgi:hypothetical protein
MNAVGKTKCYIVDIDGTIADCGHRIIHISNPHGTKNWEVFNSMLNLDEPKTDVLRVVDALNADGYPIILVTGRSSRYQEATIQWLIKHRVPFRRLLMRKDGDYRSDHIIKREIYHEQIYPLFDVVGVFEDRDAVVDMWRKEGLTCFQVQKGDY